MRTTKEWKIRKEGGDPLPPDNYLAGLAQRLHVSLRFARMLWSRGFQSFDAISAYLSPGLRLLSHPSLWPGISDAARLIADGLLAGRKLAVWGDYDVDGVTSTALVLQVLEHYGYSALWHLPDRRTEGYGMNTEGIDELAAQGVTLLLTVDCGISDAEAIRHAREIGMTVVVSDHHLPPEELPEADAICNPRLEDCPCRNLAGVGVAFFLMAEVNTRIAEAKSMQRMDLRNTLDLVALGTLADLVELEGQNRILVKNGLLKVTEGKRIGLAALKSASGFTPGAPVGAGQVVFSIAPRINAAGRVDSAESSLALLRASDQNTAYDLARRLDELNTARRAEEERITAEALLQADAEPDAPAVIVFGDGWNQGVIGIVASRLVERYHRPSIVLCTDGQTLKGSGRSISGFDLHAGLAACASELISYGGHRMAAGLRVSHERYESFRAAFRKAVVSELGDVMPEPILHIDGELDFKAASDSVFLKELDMMQPLGVGNPEPVFTASSILIRSRRLFGPKKDHVMLELLDESCGITMSAKAWRQADDFPADMEGRRIRIAYCPAVDNYNGTPVPIVKIKDWKLLPA
ncbi:MAG: single-stranded-DNA-specific exonuclease RecJ [Mailhella sp.]|nr:single-stranded-DNA-specific exonuclease RecJ [Mailhella sp.]